MDDAYTRLQRSYKEYITNLLDAAKDIGVRKRNGKEYFRKD